MVSFALAFISGVVLSGAYAPLNWWFLVPVAIAIFLYAVTKTSKPFLAAFVFAAAFNFLTLKWSGIYVGLVPVLFLVLLQSLFYLPLGLVSFRRDRYSRLWLALPILLIADELRSIIPFGGFGWNRLSFSQADSPYVSIAAFFGDTALAFAGISLGIGLYLLFARAQLLSVGIIAASISLIILLPTPSLNQGSINVLGIQGNVPRLGLDFNSRAEEVFNLHLEQSLIALKQVQTKPDLMVWPENSVDIDPFINSLVGQRISDLAKDSQTPIVVGAVLKSSEGPKNASVMWSSDGEVVSKYEKRTLTPFGEYIPLRFIAELITPFANDVDDFVKGDEIILHKIGESKIAPIICYEIIDDSAVNSIVNKANLMLVQTNNATFADSGQSMQQLNITRIRAVEQNKWVVSVSTTGVSAIIDNKGSVRQITEQNRASYVSAAVMLNSNQTLASKLGNWSSLLLILLALTVYLGKRRRSD